MHAPLLDQHAGFGQRVEHLARQQPVAQIAVEALDVAVLPWAGRLYNAVRMPIWVIHSITAVAVNSPLLSERMNPGAPRLMKGSASTSVTSVAPSVRATQVPPPIVGRLRHRDRPDRIRHRLALPDQDLTLPKLADDLLRRASRSSPRHPTPACAKRTLTAGGLLLGGRSSGRQCWPGEGRQQRVARLGGLSCHQGRRRGGLVWRGHRSSTPRHDQFSQPADSGVQLDRHRAIIAGNFGLPACMTAGSSTPNRL